MTGNLSLFDNYSPCKDHRTVEIADGAAHKIIGFGTIKINERLILTRVLYVPKLTCNLLSIRRIVKDYKCLAIFDMCYFQERESNRKRRLAVLDSPPDSTALEGVEEALSRLEGLLQELHMSSSDSGKEHLKAACSDLERIRRLKKEAEFLEASFRAKAASLERGNGAVSSLSTNKDIESANADTNMDRRAGNPRGLWRILVRHSIKSSEPVTTADDNAIAEFGKPEPDSNEIQRFEVLRNELMELEKRVQKSANNSQYEEDEIQNIDDTTNREVERSQLVQVQKKENIMGKSIEKLKETSTDVWQGTQLLAIDVAAALALLRRVLIGDDLTEKEKQALRRTLTDLASVVPIGFLMLLPVTAVGHAAMLAAIQRYMPSLIPSTYGSERLNLLRQLEKVKEMEDEVEPSETAAE